MFVCDAALSVRDGMFGVEGDSLVEIGDRLIVLVDPMMCDATGAIDVRHRQTSAEDAHFEVAKRENKACISYRGFGFHREAIGGRFAPGWLCSPGSDAPFGIVSKFG
jgi:hypothetical protein